MEQKKFIDTISDSVVKSCGANDLLPSPSIAQAILESGWGSSELALKANAIFGIKADSRWSGKKYLKVTQEYVGNEYKQVQAYFRAYDDWGESIIDHALFLVENKRYKNLIGVTDYKKYCELIKADGYATSPDYDTKLINIIEKYNLAQYDVQSEKEPAKKPTLSFNIHAGHNPAGMVACGTVGYLNESVENRKVCTTLKTMLQRNNYTVYDCTCNDGKNKMDVLEKICAKCNEHIVDYDISIHFNAFEKEYISDKKTKGVECYIYPSNLGGPVETTAKSICNEIAKLGFTNRGVKTRNDLYFLRNTKNKAILIECCFADDIDDFELYDCGKMAQAVFKGLGCIEKSVEDKSRYYVVLGSFEKYDMARSFADTLKEDAYIADEHGNLMRGIIAQIERF